MNDRQIQVSGQDRLMDSLLVTGFPYKHEGKLDQYLAIFKELVEGSRGIRRLGSAAIDLCYVAAGRLEGFYEYGLNPWDVAAGTLILQEAGGRVTDFHGGDNYLYGRKLIATNGLVHYALTKIITAHFK
jgi:myo-inositol-1(or 4)-monophosphatase